MVLCPSPLHPAAARRARAFYEQIGCEVIEQTPEGHDRVMAYTHALTFFVAKGMLDAGAGEAVPFAPPSFHAISRTIEAVRADAGHLFRAIQGENPYAAEARRVGQTTQRPTPRAWAILCRRRTRPEAVLVRVRRRRRAAREAALREDVAHVAGHRLLADAERAGDRAVRLPRRDEAEHLDLARREGRGRACHRRRVRVLRTGGWLPVDCLG